MEEEVIHIFDEMKAILKTNKKKRDTEFFKNKVEIFKSKLSMTMKFWPRDVFEKMSNDEDKLFLESMMSDRIATMGSVDAKLSLSEKKIAQRKLEEQKRENKEKIRQMEQMGMFFIYTFFMLM